MRRGIDLFGYQFSCPFPHYKLLLVHYYANFYKSKQNVEISEMSNKKIIFSTNIIIKETSRGYQYVERKGKESVAIFLVRRSNVKIIRLLEVIYKISIK